MTAAVGRGRQSSLPGLSFADCLLYIVANSLANAAVQRKQESNNTCSVIVAQISCGWFSRVSLCATYEGILGIGHHAGCIQFRHFFC